jgi:hypothetical protein
VDHQPVSPTVSVVISSPSGRSRRTSILLPAGLAEPALTVVDGSEDGRDVAAAGGVEVWIEAGLAALIGRFVPLVITEFVGGEILVSFEQAIVEVGKEVDSGEGEALDGRGLGNAGEGSQAALGMSLVPSHLDDLAGGPDGLRDGGIFERVVPVAYGGAVDLLLVELGIVEEDRNGDSADEPVAALVHEEVRLVDRGSEEDEELLELLDIFRLPAGAGGVAKDFSRGCEFLPGHAAGDVIAFKVREG